MNSDDRIVIVRVVVVISARLMVGPPEQVEKGRLEHLIVVLWGLAEEVLCLGAPKSLNEVRDEERHRVESQGGPPLPGLLVHCALVELVCAIKIGREVQV